MKIASNSCRNRANPFSPFFPLIARATKVVRSDNNPIPWTQPPLIAITTVDGIKPRWVLPERPAAMNVGGHHFKVEVAAPHLHHVVIDHAVLVPAARAAQQILRVA